MAEERHGMCELASMFEETDNKREMKEGKYGKNKERENDGQKKVPRPDILHRNKERISLKVCRQRPIFVPINICCK
jgi:hypothetical protein